jgi:hypothetical protein
VGDLGITFDRARSYGFVSIELPYGYKDVGPEAFATTHQITLDWFALQRAELAG